MSTQPYHPGPTAPSPEERLILMDEDGWEDFIYECAWQLKKEGAYIEVAHLGGAGDKGRDVCGYTVHPPIEDSWDLYQAKHYSNSLSPSEFSPELAKFLYCVFTSEYPRPSNYYICALVVGPKLYDYTLNPKDMKAWILGELEKETDGLAKYTKHLDSGFREFINNFPFNIFRVKPAKELLEIHFRSPGHWSKFGVLPPRDSKYPAPTVPVNEEQKYIDALLDVYVECTGVAVLDPSSIPKKYQKHFIAQRALFYSAEGLYRFSRDKIPGAFEALVDEIEIGIGAVLMYPHEDGMTRLKEVLNTANSLNVNANPLSMRLQAGDLQGTCHHLANQERINWVDEE